MRPAPLQELVRTLGIRIHLPRNSTTYHCVHDMWLTCGGKPQVRFPRQRGAHYTTLQGAMSSAKILSTSVQSRKSAVHLDSVCIDRASSRGPVLEGQRAFNLDMQIMLNVQHAVHWSCLRSAQRRHDVTTAEGLTDLCLE
jgi:hypothetical protein